MANTKISALTATTPAASTHRIPIAISPFGAGDNGYLTIATIFTSPALTGSPTAPTQAPGTNNTTIATTAYVDSLSLVISTGLTNTAGTLTANLSTGVSGGQSVIGGTASGNSLTLSSTSHATKGTIIFGTSNYNESTNLLTLGGRVTATATGTLPGVNVGTNAGDPSTTVVADLWYNSSTGALRTRTGSGNSMIPHVAAGASTATRVAFWNATTGLLSESANFTFVTNRILGTTLYLTLSAGTATAGTCPLIMTTGTVLTTAIAGGIEYNNTFHMTNSDATRRHVVLAATATKTTAGAPYTNDGYVTISIGGTDVRVMTTA